MSAPNDRNRRAHRLLAGAAVVLALAALAAGDPPGARVDVAALARTVEAEEDHVTALELATWIRDRKPGLRVVDVRPAAEFDAYHLPTAENLPLTALTGAGFRADETVVLYAEGGTQAVRGWVILRAAGVERAHYLRGGLHEWMTEIVEPTLAADATPAERSVFARKAEISRYFGGTPRIAGSASSPASGEESTSDGESAADLPARPAEEGGAVRAAIRRADERGC
ncbi:MAG TPA: rhodanese-like domain-containing protein [Longimicrobium sp.]|nr:rhodanese-like domain-containing protein [Longimicrobium sp.]